MKLQDSMLLFHCNFIEITMKFQRNCNKPLNIHCMFLAHFLKHDCNIGASGLVFKCHSCVMYCSLSRFEHPIIAIHLSMASSRLAPKGGYRQRLAKQCESSKAAEEPSQLATYLITKWSWGLLPAVQVQEICTAAVRDGTKHPEVIALSTLGSSGQSRNHCHRDLVGMLKPPALAGATSTFKLPLASGNHHREIDQEFCLPHAMFAAM